MDEQKTIVLKKPNYFALFGQLFIEQGIPAKDEYLPAGILEKVVGFGLLNVDRNKNVQNVFSLRPLYNGY